MRVTFFLAGESDIGALRAVDPDRDWHQFKRGERIWILQAYLRLVRAGHPAELSAEAPEDGLVVFHAKQDRELLRQSGRLRDAVLVGVRADNSEPPVADFQLLQNGRFADERRRFFVPHWPQPALVPRDPTRGERVERVAYRGFHRNLHPDFLGSGWSDFLRGINVDWSLDSVEFAGPQTDRLDFEWSDYRDVDLVLAVRPNDGLDTSKPASKLVNAWMAGVPALLGPEFPYREQRRSELDYLEVSSLAEAKAAVMRLRRDSRLYRAMVENGLVRAAEFTQEKIVSRWASLLYDTLPRLATSPRVRLWRRVPLRLRRPLRKTARLLLLRPRR